MDHTPTPWHHNVRPESKYPTILSGQNKHVVHLVTLGLAEAESDANAEFIIRACNAHYELVAALEGLFEHCAMVHKHCAGSNCGKADTAIAFARAVLAKAQK